jgi:ATP-dependent exoDNAse (exonuclease V) alpha subunit
MSKADGGDSVANFDEGYAITCHKFQGSQVPVLISIVDDSTAANWTTSREWHYTACSRAEKMLIMIGKWETLMKQAKKISLMHRKTFLVEDLQ